MNKKYLITNAVLWAAAIIAAAIVGAPAILTTVLLPALWACSFVVAGERACPRRVG